MYFQPYFEKVIESYVLMTFSYLYLRRIAGKVPRNFLTKYSYLSFKHQEPWKLTHKMLKMRSKV